MNDRLGIALVGCAHRQHAWSYARAVTSSPNARLVGVYDSDPALGHSVADDFGVPYTDDLAGLVGSDDVRAVIICGMTSEHRRHVELAADAGTHVLCEKPVATTVEDARAMVTATENAGIQFHVAFVCRFLPQVRTLRAALAQGAFGQVIGARAGNRGVPPLPPRYPPWITTPELSGGGALIDHSVHLTDVLRHLTGQEVRRVNAVTGRLLHDLAVEDCALVSLEFHGGAVANIDPSWSVPANNPWDYDFFLHLVGTDGGADLDDISESLQLVSATAGDGLRLVGFGEDPDAAMVEAFVSSVVAGRHLDPCATGTDGLRALEVALAAYDSAANGSRSVPLGA
ncbi:Gfo/Idh/MocA family protein [Actinopolymorpha singaporensis]|uniref:Predicted dehydrogenase n=1 Tax=Actinopolymorpha singaporensis TaxID=117157 RepID=A0A1H1V1J0_9ACTN|nr:Gfo/Idh/MocA family oxidoreductase [Actinopolymorpha singaporensis]SDS78543.1 Predicted dehydrogenase [Actinopolymorpha singaporensis]